VYIPDSIIFSADIILVPVFFDHPSYTGDICTMTAAEESMYSRANSNDTPRTRVRDGPLVRRGTAARWR